MPDWLIILLIVVAVLVVLYFITGPYMDDNVGDSYKDKKD